jgi:hypothetical protein
MTHEQRAAILQQLAHALEHRRLLAPTRIALDIIAPMSFLAGQAALFINPLIPAGRWHSYVAALSDQEGWNVLRDMLETP